MITKYSLFSSYSYVYLGFHLHDVLVLVYYQRYKFFSRRRGGVGGTRTKQAAILFLSKNVLVGWTA
jgi:hypothetical protein